MKKVYLSIVVPVFNSEIYLEETLKSLSSQNYDNFEVLLVDDGSTDNSSNICDRFASEDKRFRVIHKQNEGVSVARNEGIQYAKGDIITFLDSDDWVEPSYCATICENIGCNDLLIFQTCKHFTDGIQQIIKPRTGSYTEKNEIEQALDTVYSKYSNQLGWPWNKVYRRDRIVNNDIYFPEDISLFEDQVFVLRYMKYVQKMTIISDVLHHYRVLDNSLTSKKIKYEPAVRTAEYLHSLSSDVENASLKDSLICDVINFRLKAAESTPRYVLKYYHLKESKRLFFSLATNRDYRFPLSMRKILGWPILVGFLLYIFKK